MLHETKDPASLREQVTTPGGATAEGLKVMKEQDFFLIIKQAIEATNKKAMGGS
jgi:pyrroline-5-carboxylate reductase